MAKSYMISSEQSSTFKKEQRPFEVFEKDPIIDYNYSIEPSTVKGNEPGTDYDKKGVTPPTPQYYWVIRFK